MISHKKLFIFSIFKDLIHHIIVKQRFINLCFTLYIFIQPCSLADCNIFEQNQIPKFITKYAHKHNLSITSDYYIDKKDIAGYSKIIYPCLDANNCLYAIVYKNKWNITIKKPNSAEIIYKECH